MTTENTEQTDLVVGKAARLGVPNFGVVVHTERWLSMSANVGFEALTDELGGGDGGVKGLVGYAEMSS